MTETLSDREETLVLAAVAALETSDGLVPADAFPALADDALRAAVAGRLNVAGRTLIAREHRTVAGYTSGYDDTVARQLAADGIGLLPEVDRAVLAIVLLRTVAIPRAGGLHQSTSWLSEGPGTSIAEIHSNTDDDLTYALIRPAVRRLKARRLLRTGYLGQILPGPALLRLTEPQSARLWEDLVLVTLPDSPFADVIRRQRERQGRGPRSRSAKELES
ncbi:hypothetical protein ACIQWA_07910 [Kitasatospora sp. NPDC098652]|uniref:hypothetical protein n=1 Tax=Kitasatospora sp. NPDC098652 TaxID=3364095 RepID=UPI0038177DAC